MYFFETHQKGTINELEGAKEVEDAKGLEEYVKDLDSHNNGSVDGLGVPSKGLECQTEVTTRNGAIVLAAPVVAAFDRGVGPHQQGKHPHYHTVGGIHHTRLKHRVGAQNVLPPHRQVHHLALQLHNKGQIS